MFERATRWFVGLSETEAFADLQVEQLLVVLFEWATENVTESENRIGKLETLLRLVENLAPDSDTGLKVARAWAEHELVGAPEFLRRTLELLDQYARKAQPAQPQA